MSATRKLLTAVFLATAGGLTLFAGALIWVAIDTGPLRDPEEALRDFYQGRNRAEEELIDPLLLNGSRAVPLVISALPNKEMPKRRYAIGFLGIGGYRSALPVLEDILTDGSDPFYVRRDALEAIYRIDPERARVLARSLEDEDEPL